MTGTSTLDPDNFPETPDRTLGSGHGTGALGPSDSSDSGSDLVGAAGRSQDEVLDLGSGTTSDLEAGSALGAGPDLGDPDLDSDTDASGTGERAAAGRDTVVRDGADIDVDHVESISSVPLDEDDLAFMASAPPGQAPGGKKGTHR
ncbi:hypothetical protein [Massilia genomosp. 1]|uniref:Chemotaxis protein n=1 Tax=Massilia genomosp. 1 TaxID=2609280 RepID=A0ABX0MH60_9BURK|nr:hypothetical protein [Massilia genomosp. 1]NHZ61676.1 hypothetical protein [Massilia genomosp. 1]